MRKTRYAKQRLNDLFSWSTERTIQFLVLGNKSSIILIGAIVASFGVFAQTENEVLLHLSFDGEIIDESNYSNTFGVNGSVLFGDDRNGNSNAAMNFTGTQFLNVISESNFNNLPAYTISFFCKPAEESGAHVIINKITPGRDYVIEYTNGKFNNNHTESGVSGLKFVGSPTPSLVNEWYHIAYVYDGTEIKFYIDGVLVNSRIVQGAPNDSGGNMSIGAFNSSSSLPYKGMLDELIIRSVALSEQEILDEISSSPVEPEIIGPAVACNEGQVYEYQVTGEVLSANWWGNGPVISPTGVSASVSFPDWGTSYTLSAQIVRPDGTQPILEKTIQIECETPPSSEEGPCSTGELTFGHSAGQCAGVQMDFWITGWGFDTYEWFVDGVSISPSSTFSFTPTESFQIKLVGSNNGCSNEIIEDIDIVSTDFMISGSTEVCAGSTNNQYSVSPFQAAGTYSWGYEGAPTTVVPTIGETVGVDFGDHISSGEKIKVQYTSPEGCLRNEELAVTLSQNCDTDVDVLLYLPFDGDYIDRAVDQNSLTEHGTITYVEDRHGNPNSAALFTGSQYLDVTTESKFDNLPAYSISFFVKPSNASGAQVIINKVTSGRDFVIEYTNGKFSNNHTESGTGGLVFVGAPEASTVNEWHHVAYVYDGESIKFYINGELVNSKTVQGVPGGAGNNMSIGAFNSSSILPFEGVIDELIIREVAMSQDDVLKEIAGYQEPGIIGYDLACNDGESFHYEVIGEIDNPQWSSNGGSITQNGTSMDMVFPEYGSPIIITVGGMIDGVYEQLTKEVEVNCDQYLLQEVVLASLSKKPTPYFYPTENNAIYFEFKDKYNPNLDVIAFEVFDYQRSELSGQLTMKRIGTNVYKIDVSSLNPDSNDLLNYYTLEVADSQEHMQMLRFKIDKQ